MICSQVWDLLGATFAIGKAVSKTASERLYRTLSKSLFDEAQIDFAAAGLLIPR